MSEGPLLQDPGETLDYSLDWTQWLGGDTISTSAWAIAPSAGVILSNESNTNTGATAFVSGLTLGQVYVLKNTIVTADGRTTDDGVTIRCFPK